MKIYRMRLYVDPQVNKKMIEWVQQVEYFFVSLPLLRKHLDGYDSLKETQDLDTIFDQLVDKDQVEFLFCPTIKVKLDRIYVTENC